MPLKCWYERNIFNPFFTRTQFLEDENELVYAYQLVILSIPLSTEFTPAMIEVRTLS